MSITQLNPSQTTRFSIAVTAVTRVQSEGKTKIPMLTATTLALSMHLYICGLQVNVQLVRFAEKISETTLKHAESIDQNTYECQSSEEIDVSAGY